MKPIRFALLVLVVLLTMALVTLAVAQSAPTTIEEAVALFGEYITPLENVEFLSVEPGSPTEVFVRVVQPNTPTQFSIPSGLLSRINTTFTILEDDDVLRLVDPATEQVFFVRDTDDVIREVADGGTYQDTLNPSNRQLRALATGNNQTRIITLDGTTFDLNAALPAGVTTCTQDATQMSVIENIERVLNAGPNQETRVFLDLTGSFESGSMLVTVPALVEALNNPGVQQPPRNVTVDITPAAQALAGGRIPANLIGTTLSIPAGAQVLIYLNNACLPVINFVGGSFGSQVDITTCNGTSSASISVGDTVVVNADCTIGDDTPPGGGPGPVVTTPPPTTPPPTTPPPTTPPATPTPVTPTPPTPSGLGEPSAPSV